MSTRICTNGFMLVICVKRQSVSPRHSSPGNNMQQSIELFLCQTVRSYPLHLFTITAVSPRHSSPGNNMQQSIELFLCQAASSYPLNLFTVTVTDEHRLGFVPMDSCLWFVSTGSQFLRGTRVLEITCNTP